MTDQQVVLGIFKDEAAADAAAEALKKWGPDMGIEFGSVGILVLDDQGKLKTDKVGNRSSFKGAGIGIVLAMATPIGLAAGIIGGGLLGKLHHKGLGLSNEDRERLGGELLGGKAAVGVLTDETGGEAVRVKFADLGGTPEVHILVAESVAEVDAAAAAEPTATTA